MTQDPGTRTMGPGWITVSAESITTEQQLCFWLDVVLDYGQTPRM